MSTELPCGSECFRARARVGTRNPGLRVLLVMAWFSLILVSQPLLAQYTWNNVYTGGGGGFVDGVVFSTAAANVVYARTDIGGCYRLDPSTNRWVPLLDSYGWNDWNLTGCVSIAADPTNANIVYAAVGTYTNSWTTENGAILRSTNQGATWMQNNLPFKLGGNMPGRGMGERLAIDPNQPTTLYLAAPSGYGLWKSTDSGTTWAATNFPDVGTYMQTPGDPYAGDNQGDVWVTFDKTSGTTSSGATKTFYVGVADVSAPVWVTHDGGSTWSNISPETGFLPHKGKIDIVNGYLYVALSDKGGPYDGGSGDVYRLTTSTGQWTLISPYPHTDTNNDYYGYSGLSVDRSHPSTVMVTGYSSWWPDTFIFRSTNSGATWTNIWSWTSYPNRSFKETQDVSAAPWLTFPLSPCPVKGRPGPNPDPKIGWMTEALEIDPFNSNRFMYGTGATLYGSNDLTDWDISSTSQITISVFAPGIEETSVLGLISPPSGANLLSALGDIAGFVHTSLTTAPSTTYGPIEGTNTSIDYAELSPSTIVRVGSSGNSCETHLAYSTNGGSSWTMVATDPTGLTGPGVVAVSANGGTFLWSPQGTGVQYKTPSGRSWTASTGIPAGAIVASDRVNSNKFYGFSAGKFYLSTDGGKTFTATAATGLPANSSVHFKAVPGIEGDIWLAGGSTTDVAYGLWHSTNSGASFTQLTNVQQADNVGFGKAATGQAYMALYIPAEIGGVRGIFRSVDKGTTWVEINDSLHQWGIAGSAAITGDPRIYGRVYLSTNGRGIIYGDGP